MGYDKGHMEFTSLNLKESFNKVAGYPPGFSERILAGSLDEKNKVGNRTRIFRIEPGAFSTVPFVHEYWEEVFLIEGDLICGSDANGKGGSSSRDPLIASGHRACTTDPSHRKPVATYSKRIISPRSDPRKV